MRTHAIEWSDITTHESRAIPDPARKLPLLLKRAARAFLALVPALGIVVAASWLITLPDLMVYLQALIWAGGFVFLGLAVESESAEGAILSLATGLALSALALLSSRAGGEFIIVAAAFVAAWIAAAILRR